MSGFAKVVQNEVFALRKTCFGSFAIGVKSVLFAMDRVVRISGTLAIVVDSQACKSGSRVSRRKMLLFV